jgi:hypothetical protein
MTCGDNPKQQDTGQADRARQSQRLVARSARRPEGVLKSAASSTRRVSAKRSSVGGHSTSRSCIEKGAHRSAPGGNPLMTNCKTCCDQGWIEGTIDGIEAPEGLVFVRRCSACGMYPTDFAAAQGREEELDAEVLGVVCREPQFTNHYRCPDDGAEWTMVWSCACNDRCPTCNHEIEPFRSDDVPSPVR